MCNLVRKDKFLQIREFNLYTFLPSYRIGIRQNSGAKREVSSAPPSSPTPIIIPNYRDPQKTMLRRNFFFV